MASFIDMIHERDFNGRTPLHFAVQDSELGFVKFLLKAGADVNERDDHGMSSVNYLSTGDKFPEICEVLIQNGANLENKESHGYTILHDAVESGHQDMVDFLIKKGVHINTIRDDGSTPLHSAIGEGNIEIVELLLNHGAVITSNNKGETQLDWAKEYDDPDILEMLEAHLENQPEIKEPE
jgi:ankyrin repeat protein